MKYGFMTKKETKLKYITNHFFILYIPQGPQWSVFDKSIFLFIFLLQESILHLPRTIFCVCLANSILKIFIMNCILLIINLYLSSYTKAFLPSKSLPNIKLWTFFVPSYVLTASRLIRCLIILYELETPLPPNISLHILDTINAFSQMTFFK